MNKNTILGITGPVTVHESTAVIGGLVCTGSENVIRPIFCNSECTNVQNK